MNKSKSPHILHFQHIGNIETGFIDVAEFEAHIPFIVKRIFWVYETPADLLRGGHAHYNTELILIAVSGKVTVTAEFANGKIDTYTLDNPSKGIYLPPYVWRTMKYSPGSVQLVLASSSFSEDDYIRNYKQFKEFYL